METKLENLIEKLKKEGVEEAKKESDRIIKEAQRKSEKMLKDAEKRAAALLESTNLKTEEFRKNAEVAIQQAARDIELAFKSRLQQMLDDVFRREVSAALSPDFMKTMILDIIKQWQERKSFDISMSAADKKQLEKVLFNGVQKKLKDTVEFSAADDMEGGFRIGLKEDNVYYDFSDDAIAGFLKSFINPRIREILDKSNG